MFRTRIRSEYVVRGMITVLLARPVYGSSSANAAIDGTVYKIPVTVSAGPRNQWNRWATSASGSASRNPHSNDQPTSVRCSTICWRISTVWSFTHDQSTSAPPSYAPSTTPSPSGAGVTVPGPSPTRTLP